MVRPLTLEFLSLRPVAELAVGSIRDDPFFRCDRRFGSSSWRGCSAALWLACKALVRKGKRTGPERRINGTTG